MSKFEVGEHVIYRGKSYTFPGEVTMRDGTGVVVKAFGDASGNYSGMKHIYADHVLQSYLFDDASGIPPLMLFADENPFPKMRQWVERYSGTGGKIGIAAIVALLAELDTMQADVDEAKARLQSAITCEFCGGIGMVAND